MTRPARPLVDDRVDASTPERIGRAATLALYDELALTPKPGLVTLEDAGSHDDMDARTFIRSLTALRPSFIRFAELGAAGAPFDALEHCGLDAEARMYAATAGINTHRGAIFTLGLLCATAGAIVGSGLPIDADRLRRTLVARWGDALARRATGPPRLPGGFAAQRHGLRGASAEASLGFPALFETALPAWERARARRLTPQRQRLDTLFHVIATLDDCNLAHRGGLAGLRDAQRIASDFLASGGAAHVDGVRRARAIGALFVSRRLSPGGAADLLSAACWFERVRSR